LAFGTFGLGTVSSWDAIEHVGPMTRPKLWLALIALTVVGAGLWISLRSTKMPVGQELLGAIAELKAVNMACEKFLMVDAGKLGNFDQQWASFKSNLNEGEAAMRELLVFQIAEQISYSSEGGEGSLKAECAMQVLRLGKAFGPANPLAMRS
jgi:hypothetical protein